MDKVEVTQEDIEAARALVGVPADPDFHATDHAVQAFARHRIAAEAAAEQRGFKLGQDTAVKVERHRFGSPPEPMVNPSAEWCDAYADWYYQGRG